MKYRVKEGQKTTPEVSAQKVLSLFKKGFISESALVLDPKGKSITVGEFVRRMDEQIASTLNATESAELPAIPGTADDDEDLVELQIADPPPTPPAPAPQSGAPQPGAPQPAAPQPAAPLPPPVPVVDVFAEAQRNVYQPAPPPGTLPSPAGPGPAGPSPTASSPAAPGPAGGPGAPSPQPTQAVPPPVQTAPGTPQSALPGTAPLNTRPPRSRIRKMPPVAQRCAFPGSMLGAVTRFIEHKSRRGPVGPRIAMNGFAEGLLYCISFACIAVVTLHQTFGGRQDSSVESFLSVVLTLSVLAALFVALHFINTRLIQTQPRFFQLEYRVLDRIFMQAFLIVQTFVIIGVALGTALYLYQTLTSGRGLGQPSAGISGNITKLIYAVAIVGVFYRGSSLESLGLRQDDSATPTETFLACLMAGLRMPMTMSGWLHLLGVICLTLNAVYALYLAFAKTGWASWALSLMPLAILGLVWPLLTTVLAMVGGTVVEILRAILSIERSVIATYGEPAPPVAEPDSPFDG